MYARQATQRLLNKPSWRTFVVLVRPRIVDARLCCLDGETSQTAPPSSIFLSCIGCPMSPSVFAGCLLRAAIRDGSPACIRLPTRPAIGMTSASPALRQSASGCLQSRLPHGRHPDGCGGPLVAEEHLAFAGKKGWLNVRFRCISVARLASYIDSGVSPAGGGSIIDLHLFSNSNKVE